MPRLRLAVLLDHLNAFSGGYEAQLRDAIHDKCREAGHHLLLVYGGPANAPRPPDAADNAIYELLRPESADGIIVVSSLLSTYCGPDGVARLVERFTAAAGSPISRGHRRTRKRRFGSTPTRRCWPATASLAIRP
jgi:hypothetical protein